MQIHLVPPFLLLALQTLTFLVLLITSLFLEKVSIFSEVYLVYRHDCSVKVIITSMVPL